MQCHHHNYITAPKDGPVDDESTVSCKDDSSPVSICALEFLRGNTWGLGTNLKHSKQTNCFGKGESTSECIKQTQPQFSKTNEGHTTGHTQVDESKRASVDHTRSFNRTQKPWFPHRTGKLPKTVTVMTTRIPVTTSVTRMTATVTIGTSFRTPSSIFAALASASTSTAVTVLAFRVFFTPLVRIVLLFHTFTM
jgi:hypothetical protein